MNPAIEYLLEIFQVIPLFSLVLVIVYFIGQIIGLVSCTETNCHGCGKFKICKIYSDGEKLCTFCMEKREVTRNSSQD